MMRSAWARRWVAGAVLPTLAALCACQDTHILTGTFRSVANAQSQSDGSVTLDSITGFQNLHLEMVIGHYGGEVAGILRFWKDKDFQVTAGSKAFCGCRHFKVGGAFDSDASLLTFSIPSPSPCVAPNELTDPPLGVVSVKLEMSPDGDRLEGSILDPVLEPPILVPVMFDRQKVESELTTDDLKCDEPLPLVTP